LRGKNSRGKKGSRGNIVTEKSSTVHMGEKGRAIPTT